MNLPNQLTVARLVLTFVFVVLTASPKGWGHGWAFSVGLAVFAIASITDYFDGYLARKHNLITAFGKLMDPLADKVLMCAAFVLLSETDGGKVFPGWVTVTILAREFLVTGLRLVASAQGSVLAADRLGKHKTAWQMISATYFLVYLASREKAFAWLQPLYQNEWFGVEMLGKVLIAITLATTVFSGWIYFWKNRRLVLEQM